MAPWFHYANRVPCHVEFAVDSSHTTLTAKTFKTPLFYENGYIIPLRRRVRGEMLADQLRILEHNHQLVRTVLKNLLVFVEITKLTSSTSIWEKLPMDLVHVIAGYVIYQPISSYCN
jgi:hypothetical protein